MNEIKTAKITKIEIDGEVSSVEFNGLKRGEYIADFDLEQLGEDVQVISENDNWVMVTGLTLKVGDSITNEKVGEPILGTLRKDGVEKNFSITPTPECDHRNWLQNKSTY